MRRRTLACAAAAALCALLAGCTVGPSARPAIVGGAGPAQSPQSPRPSGPDVPPLENAAPSGLFWGDCESVPLRTATPKLPATLPARCATMSAPLGSDTLPSTASARISLLRVGTGRVPLVVLNDADGEPGTVFAARLASRLPPQLLSRFSLIGMDRRGTGASDGVDCVPREDRAAILGYDPARNDVEGLLRPERDAVLECQTSLENRLRTLDTERTVGDLELLRRHLGVRHLNALGRGEGARVFGQYASQHPRHTGRMVFDGFPDPSAEIQDRVDTRAAAAESTFDAFAESCTADGCSLGGDPRGAVTALLAKLGGTPLSTPNGVTITAGMATNALLAGLRDPDRWPELARALADARRGDGSALAGFVRPLLEGSTESGSRFDARMVTGCNDDPARTTPQQVRTLVKQWRVKHPLFGATMAQRLLLCLPWPPAANPVGKPDGKNLPPLLVVSTADDPVTPTEGTERAGQRLDSARTLSWQGAGHGALGRSDCADNAATRFLVQGRLPSPGTVCPA